MHEGATITAPEELRVQQSDMAEFEAEFQAPIPEHTHTIDCGHHHAEEVHIDHPEDHAAIATDGHEGEHDHHEHVHGKGCGHVGYEDASEHIDASHEHNEHCGHLPHGDAKAHVDKPHEELVTHHNEAAHKHEHHAGCGHVGYEKAEASVDKVYIDHDQKQTHEAHDHTKHEHHAGCGHVGYEQADAHVDHDHGHAKAHTHSHEAEVQSHQEIEHVPLTFTQHVEEVRYQQSSDVQERIAHTHVEDARVVSGVEAEPIPETAKVIEFATLPEKPIEYVARREAKDAASDLIDTVTEKTIESEEHKPVVEMAILETESNSDMPKIDLGHDQVITQPAAEVTATEETVIRPPQLAYENELIPEDLFTETTISSEAVPVVVDVAISEVFESLDIKSAMLPVLEADTTDEASAEQPGIAIESTLTSPTRDAESVHAMNELLVEVATAVVERYEDIEGQLSSVAPQQMQEIQKALTNIRTALRLSRESGTMPENMQRQLTQLLQLLGFEDPSRALAAYIHQYGIDFIDALMARMFELLNHGQYFERLRMLLPQTADDQDTALITRLGVSVIRLLMGRGEQVTLSA